MPGSTFNISLFGRHSSRRRVICQTPSPGRIREVIVNFGWDRGVTQLILRALLGDNFLHSRYCKKSTLYANVFQNAQTFRVTTKNGLSAVFLLYKRV